VSKLRLAMIGVGHLGQIHARLIQQAQDAELVAIVDPSEAARTAIGAELRVASHAEHFPLLGQIDAAIIATPSRLHHAVALDLLRHGIHVFVEKPITLNVGDADELIAEAAARDLVLQVGHVERFNPAFIAAQPHLCEPKYIDAVRCGPFTCRSTDVGVVLDLMIHDIDLVLAMVDEELLSVHSLGAAVFGPNEDWAQARLTFAGGCVANLSASRVAWQAQRTMQVVSCEGTVGIDFAARRTRLMRTGERLQSGGFDVAALDASERGQVKDRLFTDFLPLTDLSIAETNPLAEEQREFIAAIGGQADVRVSGRSGRRALDVAERILTEIAAHRWEGAAAGAIGPRFQTRDAALRGPHWRQAARRRKAG
jgi:predicted dehydrogenase